MPTQNAIKLTDSGISVYDGDGLFTGVSLVAGPGIAIDNTDPNNPVINSSIDEFVWYTDGPNNPQNNSGYVPVTPNSGPARIYTLNRLINAPFIGFTFAVQGLPGEINWAVAGVLGASVSLNGVVGTRINSTNPTDGAEFVCVRIVGNQSYFSVRSVTGNLIVSSP